MKAAGPTDMGDPIEAIANPTSTATNASLQETTYMGKVSSQVTGPILRSVTEGYSELEIRTALNAWQGERIEV